ncbi:thiamine-phosphate kinase [Beijerinckia sp. L45]|uniref:thiamine-phosphate kinase n=1 Tax=Beijerinckia sp. L45 TaxID=1641855 RepID=UPI00131CFC0D|nr:thiamine-phosphate kinase [Beijerinckia sp. L45]
MRPSEDDLIATLFAPIAGPGGLGLRDDAALITPSPGHDLVVTKDMLVAGVHFFAGDPPDAIARKALRVNLSDLAAKGARPLGFCLGIGLPTDWTGGWLAAFATGLGDDAAAFRCALLGGDTVMMPGPLTLSITAFGEVPAGRMVPRTGARAGDLLYVSGTIGDAAIGLRLRLDARDDAGWIATLGDAAAEVLLERYLLPRPRLALAPALLACASAAMDVSDGLAGDLGKMLALAGLTAAVDVGDVPMSDAARAAIALAPTLIETALTGGDDYEILCAVPADASSSFEDMAREAGVAVRRLGITATGAGAPVFRDASGAALAFAATRFSHF